MPENVVIGLDLSTHGAKALAVTQTGDVVALAEKKYHRTIGLDGSHIQSMQEMTSAVIACMKAITEAVGDSVKFEGMSITHQRGTLIGADELGNPVVPTVCDSDTRAWQQAKQIQASYPRQELFNRTGCPPVPFNGLMKILWWYEQYPHQAALVRWWMSVQDWAVWLLSGHLNSSPGSAMRMGILNIRQPLLHEEQLLNELNIPSGKLLPLTPFGQIVGNVSSRMSELTGLPFGLPIFPAPGDQPAAVLGTNATGLHAATINLGTSFLLSFVLQKNEIQPGEVFSTLEVLPENRYALEYGEGAGTNILDWLRNNLLAVNSFVSINKIARKSERGARGVVVVPHWWAIMDTDRCGTITGLRSHNTRGDVIRATYEGLAYEVRICWEKLVGITGDSPSSVTVCGGASQNDLFCDILANVLNKPVYQTVCKEASAFGAAITAAAGIGWNSSVFSAAEKMVGVETTIPPNMDDYDFYKDGFQNYLAYRERSKKA
jgi:sugar (pentulose or hexulose) kinase